jgi:hypothetical protein
VMPEQVDLLNPSGSLYAPGEVSDCPCGCVTQWTGSEWHHFVLPGCPFDDRYHHALRGYVYRRWDERPGVVLRKPEAA